MIGIFAGRGDLPGTVATRLRRDGTVPVICEIEGHPVETDRALPHLSYCLETLGGALETLRLMGVSELCLAGGVHRPDIRHDRLDDATRPMISRLAAAMNRGDDAALREIMSIFEEQGFAIRAAQDIVPDLLPPAGVLTRTAPGPDTEADAEAGEAEVRRLGRQDAGQACILRAGQVIAREGPEGTDAMLGSLTRPERPAAPSADPVSWLFDTATDIVGDAADWLSNAKSDRGGGNTVLFKAPKPEQDRRADLPVIGPETARRAVNAGLAGIVIEEGGVIVLDRAQTCAVLDRAEAFLWVRPPGGGA